MTDRQDDYYNLLVHAQQHKQSLQVQVQTEEEIISLKWDKDTKLHL